MFSYKGITSSRTNISKSIEYNFLDQWLGHGLLLASNENWDRKRSLLSKAFHFEALQDYSKTMNKNVDDFIQDIDKMDTNLQIDKYMDTNRTFQFTLDTISQTLLGRKFSSQQDCINYLDCIRHMTSSFTKRACNPLIWNKTVFNLTNIGKIYRKNLKKLKSITKRLISKHKGATPKNNLKKQPNLLEILLRRSPSKSMIKIITNEIDTFLFAGHDTTALAINWILYRLGTNLNKQIEIRDEIKTKLQNLESIEIKDLDQLPLLDQFIRECLRLHPPVPLIGREITEEFYIKEYTIPKGIMLYILIDEVQMNPEQFPQPMKFIPERFQSISSNQSYMPFSAGPRNCIGKRFASSLIKILLIKLLNKFRIDSNLYDGETSYNIVLKPKHKLKIKLTQLSIEKD